MPVFTLVALAVLVLAAPARGQEWSVASPDARTEIVLTRQRDGRLTCVRVSLAQLGGGSWTASIIRDGESDRTFAHEARAVAGKEEIVVPMRARGGFVIRLERARGGTK